MLRSRCGDDQDTSQPSQNISIVVSDPQRTRQGLSMMISYTIATIVRQDRRYFGGPNDEDNIKEYSVTRSHSNINSLYNCLIRDTTVLSENTENQGSLYRRHQKGYQR